MALLQKGHSLNVLVNSDNDTTPQVMFRSIADQEANASIFLEQLTTQRLVQGSYSVTH
jgi:hypothetical protein